MFLRNVGLTFTSLHGVISQKIKLFLTILTQHLALPELILSSKLYLKYFTCNLYLVVFTN
jgi:hypothetical protein